MGKMFFGLLFFAMMLLLMVVGGTWFLFNLFLKLGINPSSAAWDNLVRKLRTRTDSLAPKLVAWEKEMLPLLSLNRSEHHKPGLLGSEGYGIFTTIYHEPVVAYAVQRSKKTGLVIARTSDKEFIFRLKGRETEIWLNRQPFGVLVDGVLLSSGKTSRQIARLEASADQASFPATIGDRPAAGITNPARAEGPNPRAISLLRNLSTEEEDVALALTLLQMV